ncbi:peptidylprolyl isomerase [Emcibacter sp. SYSU 3D8]|uniref:peptidylprolyl isomerase n=1 Tax=Emcibacter sp. SYSU 3D8 TaxID=3133969 RepID=UPI0031FF0A7E
MTLRINTLAGILLLLAGAAGAAYAQSHSDVQRIVAVVNDEIISEYDVNERMQLITSTTGALRNQEEYDQLRKTVVQLLVDEKLQLQEAKEQKINITDEEVQQRFNDMAARNNISADQFTQELSRMGASKDMILRQVKAGLAWEEVINARLRPFLAIGDGEVKTYLDNLKNNKGQPEYRIGEIFLAVDSPDKDVEARQTAERLVRQIREGADFGAVARQFSDVATGAVGGDTGWVIGEHINPDIKDAVLKLQEGQVSDPIRTTAGYYIVTLGDQREVLSADPDDTQIDLQQVIVKIGSDPDAQRQRIAAQAATLKECSGVGQLASSLGATDSGSLGTVRLGDLPAPVKNAVRPLEIGQASEPLRTGTDFRVLVVCGKTVSEVKEPTPSEIEDYLSNQRLAMMARRYLRDLRRDAIIDYK